MSMEQGSQLLAEKQPAVASTAVECQVIDYCQTIGDCAISMILAPVAQCGMGIGSTE